MVEGSNFSVKGEAAESKAAEETNMETTKVYTQAEIDAALLRYAKRMEYNKAWREAHPDKVKAIRSAYNKRKWQAEKAMLAQAKAEGLL